MALENLKSSLESEGRQEAKKILSQAQRSAEETIAQAREQAKQEIAEAKRSANEVAQAETNERRSSASLKAKQTVTEALNKKIEEALTKAWEEMLEMRESKEYEKFMKNSITGAEKELGSKAVVYANSQDAKIAKKLSKNVALKAANISGGAIILSQDGKISIDCSLEAVFESKKEELKSVIYYAMTKQK